MCMRYYFPRIYNCLYRKRILSHVLDLAPEQGLLIVPRSVYSTVILDFAENNKKSHTARIIIITHESQRHTFHHRRRYLLQSYRYSSGIADRVPWCGSMYFC